MLVHLQEELQSEIDHLHKELKSGTSLGPTPLALHLLLVKYRDRLPEALRLVTLKFAEDLQRKHFLEAEEDIMNVRSSKRFEKKSAVFTRSNP
jgi:hypothetical protein